MSEKFEHKKAGYILEIREINQGMVDDYFAAYKQYAPDGETKGQSHGNTVRAAITAGWIVEPEMSVDQVRTLEPAKVRWMAEKINDAYRRAVEIPRED